MEIRIRETGQVVTEHEFRSMYANQYSFTDVITLDQLDFIGADPVMEGAQPTAGKYQSVIRVGVEYHEGYGWFTKYALRDWSEEEIATYEAQAAAAKYEAFKKAREEAVAAITVTVGDKVFDGDETSQGRMLRAIQASEITGITETEWKLADNTKQLVTADELKQAFVLAAKKQSELWMTEESTETSSNII